MNETTSLIKSYKGKNIRINPWIVDAIRSGEPSIYYSDRMSLVPQLTIGNLTIIYRKYEK
jgi:hypothetical protein